MTRLSKIARLRASAGARPGKMRIGVIECQVKKLADILGENDVFVQSWTGLVRGMPTAIKKLRNMARAKLRELKVKPGKPITVKLGETPVNAKNAMPKAYASKKFMPQIPSIK